MKKYLLTLAFAVFTTLMMVAQDCQTFLFMTTNAEVQMTMYDKKGKASGVQTWKVGDVKKDGTDFVSTINTSFKDDKGKEITNTSGTYKCNGGILHADMKMAMPQQQAGTMKPTEAKMSGAYLEYPYNMSVGQQLKDAQMDVDVDMKNGVVSKVSFKELNRKVEAKEQISTPAGSWEAYIIKYDGNMRTEMAGIGIPFNFSVKEWFVPGVGIVKSETYTKGGKLAGSSMITAIKK